MNEISSLAISAVNTTTSGKKQTTNQKHEKYENVGMKVIYAKVLKQGQKGVKHFLTHHKGHGL